jgi:FkbM family methyltransferase
MVSKPLLMKIKPLWLREKLFWKLYCQQAVKFTELFDNASLEFSPEISLKLMPTDIGHQHIALTGFVELEVSQIVNNLSKLGGLMVDVGANYGYYSCLWASGNINNHVIAFEASPRNVEPLRFNITRNNLEKQITLENLALGREKGILPFTFKSDVQSGWGGLLNPNDQGEIEVQVIPLDDYFADRKDLTIDLLKIDTEGADTWVLQGAENLLRQKKIKQIFFEENLVRMEALGIKPGIAQALLEDCGYRITKIGKREYYATC